MPKHPTDSPTLNVPGATLYYETHGSGPTLLVIPGGPQDAGVFADLARRLVGRYTVVTYDPRGNSRSRFDGDPAMLELDVQGDDAAALLRAHGDGPAYVFGTSGGAQIGLNLTARYPELVRVLVAHEPPTAMLLGDPSAALAADEALYDLYRREGVDAAMALFFGANDLENAAAAPPETAPTPEAAETFVRVSGNFEYWLAHGMLPLARYRPDVEALRHGEPRVVVGIGEASAGQPIDEMGRALAEHLGSEPVVFPGDHFGFESHTDAFVETLRWVFDSNT